MAYLFNAVLLLCMALWLPVAVLAQCGESTRPGLSCKDIFQARGRTAPNGVYWVWDGGNRVQVYCDMSAGGLQLLMKLSNGVGNKAPMSVWTDAIDSTDEADTSLFSTVETPASQQYVSRFRACWSGGNCEVEALAFKVYAGGQEKKSVWFNGEGTTSSNWFSRGFMTTSSWYDLDTASTQVDNFAMASSRRQFGIENTKNQCSTDAGWVCALKVESSMCSWENGQSVSPFLLYSGGRTASKWVDSKSVADVMAVFGYIDVTATPQRPSCAAGDANLRYVAGKDATAGTTVKDVTGNGNDAATQGFVGFAPSGWKDEEIPVLTGGVSLLDQPKNIRFASTQSCERHRGIEPEDVPDSATAILANIVTYSPDQDHAVFSFGRYGDHSCSTWSNEVYNQNAYINDVLITHGGDSDTCGYYNIAHGTHIIPLKDDGTFDATLAMGRNTGSTRPHYVTLTVIGYMLDEVGLEKTFNIQISNGGSNVRLGSQLALRTLSGQSKRLAVASLVSITTYQENRNDHMVHSFGRDDSHDSHVWDNRVYDLNQRLNDVLITHEGDTACTHYYGNSFGMQVLPFRPDNTFDIYFGLGKNGNNGAHFITIQEYGFLTSANSVIFPTPAITRTTFTNACSKQNDITLAPSMPSDAVAAIVTITAFDSSRDDHWMMSFGRNNGHDCFTWDNRPYDLNTWLNDVMLTYEGQGRGRFYYGHSFGTHIIPLKANGKIDAQFGMGKSTTSVCYVTLQTIGYLRGSRGSNVNTAITAPVSWSAPAFTVSAWFYRTPSAGTKVIAKQCKNDAPTECLFEIESGSQANTVIARVGLGKARSTWDFVVPVVPREGWHLVVLTWEQTSGVAELWLDGQNSQASVTGTIPTAPQTLVLAEVFSGGSVRDVRMYNFVLTNKEIMEQYYRFIDMRALEHIGVWWPLTRGPGADAMGSATDLSTFGNNAALQGVSWSGPVLQFADPNDAVVSSQAVRISGDAEFTFAAWVRATAVTGTRSIMGIRSTSCNVNEVAALAVIDGSLALNFGGVHVRATSHTLVPNVWYHVAASKRQGDKLASTSLFVNGNKVSTVLEGGAGVPGREGPPSIVQGSLVAGRGCASNALGTWQGAIWGVRTYTVAKDDFYVASLSGPGAVVAKWSPWNLRASALLDASANAVDGTAMNTEAVNGFIHLKSVDSAVISRAFLPFSGDSAFTLSSWLYPDYQSWPLDGRVILIAGLRSATSSEHVFIAVKDGELVVVFKSNVRLTTGIAVPLRRWTHVVVSKPAVGTIGTFVNVYVNGVKATVAVDGNDFTPNFQLLQLVLSKGPVDFLSPSSAFIGYVGETTVAAAGLSDDAYSMYKAALPSHQRKAVARLTGKGDHLQGPVIPLGGGAWALDLRVYARLPFAEHQTLFDTAETASSSRIRLGLVAGGAGMEYEVNNAPAPGSGKLSTMEAFPMNQWVHVYIYHAASGDVSMFWDGRLMSRGSVPVPATGTRPVMLIGKDIAATAPVSFEGSIAHLAIWNGDVSYQAAMAHHQLGTVASNAYLFYEFRSHSRVPSVYPEHDSTSTTVVDSSGSRFDGTLACEGCILPSVAEEPVCGNGVVETNEQCDDGNMESGDGCTADCHPEPGYFCRQESPWEASVCVEAAMRLQCNFESGSSCAWGPTTSSGTWSAQAAGNRNGKEGGVITTTGSGLVYGFVTPAGAVDDQTHVQLQARIAAASGSSAAALLITILPANQNPSPTACGGTGCGYPMYRICINTQAASGIACDEKMDIAMWQWQFFEWNIPSRFRSKYGATSTLPTSLRIQIASYAGASGGATEVYIDDFAVIQVDRPAAQCKSAVAVSDADSEFERPPSCMTIKNLSPSSGSGVYRIFPDDGPGIDVYCDMTTLGGGWIRIQRRESGAVDFYRGWNDYKNGFGDLRGNHWLGNDNIHRITNALQTEGLVEMWNSGGSYNQHRLAIFRIGSESTNYLSRFEGHSGTGSSTGWSYHSNRQFTTKDRDNDAYGANCAHSFLGGWWYGSCHYNNYNGQWHNGGHNTYADKINDYFFGGYYNSMPVLHMLVRETSSIGSNKVTLASIKVDGVEKASTSVGLNVASWMPGDEKNVAVGVYSLTTGGTAFKTMVDGLSPGQMVAGALQGQTSSIGSLSADWQTGLQALGISAPMIQLTPFRWAFIGRKGANIGAGISDVSGGSGGKLTAQSSLYYRCSDQGRVYVPENRVAPEIPLAVLGDAWHQLVSLPATAAGSVVINDGRPMLQAARGVIDAEVVQRLDVAFQAMNPVTDSGWAPMKSQLGSGSHVTIAHSIDVPPDRVTASVQLRIDSGPNEGFVFDGVGACQRTDNDASTYSGAVFAYSDAAVRVWLPSRADGTAKGKAFNIGKGWGGERYSQSVSEVSMRVRVLKNPSVDYDSGWFDFESQKGGASYKQLSHGLGEVPGRVRVLVMVVGGVNDGFVFEAVGSAQADDSVAQYSGVVYAYSSTAIRIWAPSKASGGAGGYVVGVGDGWAATTRAQWSHSAKVRVLAWRTRRPADWTSRWITVSSTPAEAFHEVAHNLHTLPSRVQVVMEVAGGANDGFYFEGTGAAQATAESSAGYGGLVFGYDETRVRLWAPTANGGNSDGRVVFVSGGWGGGTNNVAATSVRVQVRVWQGFEGVADSGTLNVTVTPVNEPPVFQGKTIVLDASVSNGDVIGKATASDPEGSPLVFSLVSGHDNAFAIDRLSGDIRVVDTSAFDYFAKPVYYLGISVSDGQLEDIGAIAIKLVKVNRAPDLPPQVREIPEGSPLNANVGPPLNYTERDTGDSLLFAIESGDDDGIFKIDPCTGQLRVAQPVLDYETTPFYYLIISLTDDGLPPQQALANVTIEVTDANDPPECGEYTFTVDENQPAGAVIGTDLIANDPEGDALTWSMANGNQAGLFMVDTVGSAGRLKMAVAGLNYESGVFPILGARATDTGGLSCVTNITILIRDVNDPPYFTLTAIDAYEDAKPGTVIATLAAVDEDDGDFATITIDPNSDPGPFILSGNDLTLGDGEELDYETTTQYSLSLLLTDNGGPINNPSAPITATATLTINVLNTNDPPRLTVAPVSVEENSPAGTVLGGGNFVSATDDEGDAISFSIPGFVHLSPFAIDAKTGVVTVSGMIPLDYETKSAWNLTIVATDDGVPPMSSQVTIEVPVDDANDPPGVVCDEDLYTFEAYDGYNTVRSKLDANVVDQDGPFWYGGGGSFGVIPFATCLEHCYDDPSCVAFTSFGKNYYAYNRAGACYGRGAGSSELSPDVADARSAVLTTLCRSYTVSEDVAPGVLLGAAMQGTDPDDNAVTMRVASVSNGVPGQFAIASTGPSLYQLSTGSIGFDYETATQHIVVIEASDGQSEYNVSTVSILVTVENVNEPPEVVDVDIRVPQGSDDGMLVGNALSAEDPEGLPVSLSIISGNSAGYFALTGKQLSLARYFDAVNGDTFTLTLRASDGTLTSDFTVVVYATEGNLRPELPAQAVSIDENSPKGTYATPDLSYSDGDLDSNNGESHTFRIAGALDPEALTLFEVTNEGRIRYRTKASMSLDYERQASYVLLITIEDAGGLTATSAITVNINDLNELPQCQMQAARVRENAVPSDSVLDRGILCTDGDMDVITPQVLWKDAGTLDPVPLQVVLMNDSFGMIVADGIAFDYETVRVYELVFDASDGTASTLYPFNLTVIDVNEPPVASDVALQLPESTAPGIVHRLVAVDPENARLSWSLLPEGNYKSVFSLDPDSGDLRLRTGSALDYEDYVEYNLTARVTDTGGAYSIVRILITVTDVNDIGISFIASSEAVVGLPMNGKPQGAWVDMNTDGGEVAVIRGSNFGPTLAALAREQGVEPADALPWGGAITVTFGPTGIEQTALSCNITIANTEIRCFTPGGVGSNLIWTITLDTTSAASSSFGVHTSYIPPSISSAVVPSTGCTSAGGTAIVLTGRGFGPAGTAVRGWYGQPGTGSYYLATCAVKSIQAEGASVASAVVECVTAPGIGGGHQWQIAVGGQISAWSGPGIVLSYDVPVIGAVTLPASVTIDTVGGTEVRLSGTNFGPKELSLVDASASEYLLGEAPVMKAVPPAAPQVAYGRDGATGHYTARECQVVTPHTLIQCRAAPGVGKALAWTIGIAGRMNVTPFPTSLAYTPPRLEEIRGAGAYNADTAGNQTVIIAGRYFGPAGLGVVPQVRYGPFSEGAWRYTAQSCSVRQRDDGSTTDIWCSTSSGTGKNHSWVLDLGGQTSNVLHASTSYAPPRITYFEGPGSVDALTTGDEVVYIHGSNFGNDDDMVQSVSYSPVTSNSEVPRVYDTSCVIQVPHRTLRCSTVPGAGTDLAWSVTVDEQQSVSPVTSYGAPEIHNIIGPHDALSTDGGQRLLIKGLNFGTQSHFESLTYGPTGMEYAFEDVVVVNHTHLEAITVPGVGVNLLVVAIVAGQSSVEGEQQRLQRPGESSRLVITTVSYATPTIESVSRDSEFRTYQPPYSILNTAADATQLVTVYGRNWGLLAPRTVVRVRFGNQADNTELPPIRPISVYPSPGDASYDPDTDLQSLTFAMPSGEGFERAVSVVVYGAGMSPSTAIASSVWTFNYSAPAVFYVEVRPWATELDGADVVVADNSTLLGLPGRVTADTYDDAVNYFGTEEGLVLLIVHGANFGRPPSDTPGALVERLLEVRETEGGELKKAPFILRWSSASDHSAIEVVTDYTNGFMQVHIGTRSPSGSAALASSSPVFFDNFSPAARKGSDTVIFATDGGVGCRACNILQLTVTFLASARDFRVYIADALGVERECGLLDDSLNVLTDASDIESVIIRNTSVTPQPPDATSEWSIRCKVPEGEGMGLRVVLKRDDKLGELDDRISYFPPTVSAALVRSSSTGAWSTVQAASIPSHTRGGDVHLVGNNFGLCPALRVDGLLIPSCDEDNEPLSPPPFQHNHTSIVFTLPEGEGANNIVGAPHEVEVLVGGQMLRCGTMLGGSVSPCLGQSLRFHYRAPTLEGVQPDIAETSGGTSVILSGLNFGAFAPGEVATYPKVSIVNPWLDTAQECLALEQLSHEELECVLPSGIGQGIGILVNVLDQTSKEAISFDYAAPQVASVTLHVGNSTTVIPLGSNNRRLSGSSLVELPSSLDLANAFLSVSGSNFAPSHFFNLSEPTTCAFLMDSGSASSLNLTSASFPACVPSENAAHMKSMNITLTDYSGVTATIPPGMGPQDLVLVVGGQVVHIPYIVTYPPPIVHAVVPHNGTTDGGQVVDIVGENLGFPSSVQPTAVEFPAGLRYITPAGGELRYSDGTVMVDPKLSYSRNKILEHTQNRIRFVTMPGFGDLSVLVSTETSASHHVRSNNVSFEYLPPVVNGIVPNLLVVGERDLSLRIIGQNFGSEETAGDLARLLGVPVADVLGMQVTFNDTIPGKNLVRLADKGTIAVDVPPLPVGPLSIQITVAGKTGITDPEDRLRSPLVVCRNGYWGQPGEVCLPCMQGGVCNGYEDGTHYDPISLPEWFKLDGPKSTCPPERLDTRDVCPLIVPCEPKLACLGDNVCAAGYTDVRCAACDSCYRGPGGDGPCQRYFRRDGFCEECPDNPWLFVVIFVCAALGACVIAYILHHKNVDLAFVAVGVDYLQVLAMFSGSRIEWPPLMRDIFHILSAFNVNLELMALECSMPDVSYVQKWFFTQALPLAAVAVFLLVFSGHLLWKFVVLRRKNRLASHASSLIAMFVVMMYILYLFLTRTTLDVFNCAPTDPPDGKEYLEVVFEECGLPGGVQMTLLPFAISSLLVYTLGFPVMTAIVIWKYRLLIMEDQLLRAKGLGADRSSNPHSYVVRKRWHRLYYLFKPQYWYWILIVIARKFMIAFTGLMFRKNPAFQLAMALLVMFIAYALQVHHRPYMSPGDRLEVVERHEERAKDESIKKNVDRTLAARLAEVSARVRRPTKKVTWDASASRLSNVTQLARSFFVNYNTVEAILLSCAVLVCLAGIMFQSGRFSNNLFTEQRDLIMYCTLLVVFFSLIYLGVVVYSEVSASLCPNACSRKARKGKGVQKKSDTLPSPTLEPSPREDRSLSTAINPLFAKLEMGLVEELPKGEEALKARLIQLLQENRELKHRMEKMQPVQLEDYRSPVQFLKRGKREYAQTKTRRESVVTSDESSEADAKDSIAPPGTPTNRDRQ